MFDCPVCHCAILVYLVHQVRSHLHRHKLLEQLKHPIPCQQVGCKKKLSRVETLVQHFKRMHSSDIDIMTSNSCIESGGANSDQQVNVLNNEDLSIITEVSNDDLVGHALTRVHQKLKTTREAFDLHVTNLVLELCGTSTIPYSYTLKQLV